MYTMQTNSKKYMPSGSSGSVGTVGGKPAYVWGSNSSSNNVVKDPTGSSGSFKPVWKPPASNYQTPLTGNFQNMTGLKPPSGNTGFSMKPPSASTPQITSGSGSSNKPNSYMNPNNPPPAGLQWVNVNGIWTLQSAGSGSGTAGSGVGQTTGTGDWYQQQQDLFNKYEGMMGQNWTQTAYDQLKQSGIMSDIEKNIMNQINANDPYASTVKNTNLGTAINSAWADKAGTLAQHLSTQNTAMAQSAMNNLNSLYTNQQNLDMEKTKLDAQIAQWDTMSELQKQELQAKIDQWKRENDLNEQKLDLMKQELAQKQNQFDTLNPQMPYDFLGKPPAGGWPTSVSTGGIGGIYDTQNPADTQPENNPPENNPQPGSIGYPTINNASSAGSPNNFVGGASNVRSSIGSNWMGTQTQNGSNPYNYTGGWY